MRRAWMLVAGLTALIAAANPATAAAEFPDRPLHLVVPYAPGGVLDFVGRLLAKSLGTTRSSFETPCGAYGQFKITRYLLRFLSA